MHVGGGSEVGAAFSNGTLLQEQRTTQISATLIISGSTAAQLVCSHAKYNLLRIVRNLPTYAWNSFTEISNAAWWL